MPKNDNVFSREKSNEIARIIMADSLHEFMKLLAEGLDFNKYVELSPSDNCCNVADLMVRFRAKNCYLVFLEGHEELGFDFFSNKKSPPQFCAASCHFFYLYTLVWVNSTANHHKLEGNLEMFDMALTALGDDAFKWLKENFSTTKHIVLMFMKIGDYEKYEKQLKKYLPAIWETLRAGLDEE